VYAVHSPGEWFVAGISNREPCGLPPPMEAGVVRIRCRHDVAASTIRIREECHFAAQSAPCTRLAYTVFTCRIFPRAGCPGAEFPAQYSRIEANICARLCQPDVEASAQNLVAAAGTAITPATADPSPKVAAGPAATRPDTPGHKGSRRSIRDRSTSKPGWEPARCTRAAASSRSWEQDSRRAHTTAHR